MAIWPHISYREWQPNRPAASLWQKCVTRSAELAWDLQVTSSDPLTGPGGCLFSLWHNVTLGGTVSQEYDYFSTGFAWWHNSTSLFTNRMLLAIAIHGFPFWIFFGIHVFYWPIKWRCVELFQKSTASLAGDLWRIPGSFLADQTLLFLASRVFIFGLLWVHFYWPQWEKLHEKFG